MTLKVELTKQVLTKTSVDSIAAYQLQKTTLSKSSLPKEAVADNIRIIDLLIAFEENCVL